MFIMYIHHTFFLICLLFFYFFCFWFLFVWLFVFCSFCFCLFDCLLLFFGKNHGAISEKVLRPTVLASFLASPAVYLTFRPVLASLMKNIN